MRERGHVLNDAAYGRTLNIVQICNRPHSSVGKIALAASRGFSRAGFTVTNIFLKGRVERSLLRGGRGKMVSYLDVYEEQGQSGIRRRLRRELHRWGGDILIAHGYHPCKYAAWASRGLHIDKKVVVFHGLGNLERLRRKLYARIFLTDWLYTGVSRAVALDVRKSRALPGGKPVHVLSNGLDIEKLKADLLPRDEARRQLGLPEDTLVFGNIGRLSDSKNQGLLIEAYALIVEKLPASRLVIIGDGSQKEALRSRVEACRLQDNVLITGFLPDARRYVQAFDLFLFPSRSEAFGLALLEAMAACVPAIVADIGGISELVGSYPFKIKPDDPHALASQMMVLAGKSSRERQQIAVGLEARAMKFDINRLEEAYLKIVSLPSR